MQMSLLVKKKVIALFLLKREIKNPSDDRSLNGVSPDVSSTTLPGANTGKIGLVPTENIFYPEKVLKRII